MQYLMTANCYKLTPALVKFKFYRLAVALFSIPFPVPTD